MLFARVGLFWYTAVDLAMVYDKCFYEIFQLAVRIVCPQIKGKKKKEKKRKHFSDKRKEKLWPPNCAMGQRFRAHRILRSATIVIIYHVSIEKVPCERAIDW